MAEGYAILHQTGAIASSGVKSSTTVSAANPARSLIMVQNQDTAALKIAFGRTATTSDYDLVLKAATGAADGSGGSFSMEDGTVYTGIISCFSAGTPSYSIIELS